MPIILHTGFGGRGGLLDPADAGSAIAAFASESAILGRAVVVVEQMFAMPEISREVGGVRK